MVAQQQQERIHVALGPRAYDIIIENGALAKVGALVRGLKPKVRVFVVTDAHVQALHGEALMQSLEREKIPAHGFSMAPGEGSKDFSTLEKLVNNFIAAGIERNDIVVAFGGGVVGDLASFAASIVLRGVDFVQIPTSLLAQVDSSVGGKTGINLSAGKNLVGTFHQPKLVIIDPDVLDTLPARELRAGYAEIAKIALIKDAAFFAWLEKNSEAIFKNTPQRNQAIAASCRLKAQIVTNDEREANERMLLNFGHTFGHALETLNGYSDKLLHGEAVAIGACMAFRFSAELGLCKNEDVARVEQHFKTAGLSVSARGLPGITVEKLLNTMLKDKKVTGGQITLILSKGIGEAFVSHNVERAQLAAFLQTKDVF